MAIIPKNLKGQLIDITKKAATKFMQISRGEPDL